MYQSLRLVSGGLLCLLFVCMGYAQKAGLQKTPDNRLFDSLLSTGGAAGRLLPKVNLFDGNAILAVKGVQAGVEYSYYRDTAAMAFLGVRNLYATAAMHLSAEVLLWQMPFHMQLKAANGVYTTAQPPFNAWPSAVFDHDTYMQQVQAGILQKIKPEQVLAANVHKINAIKAKYEQLLDKDINKVQEELMEQYHTAIPVPDHITNLSQGDLVTVKNQLITAEEAAAYPKNIALLQQLNESNRQDAATDSMRAATLKNIKRYEAMEKMYAKITAAKSRFENNEAVKKLRAQMPFQPADFKNYLKNPSQLSEVVKNHTSLSALQNTFMHVTKLDLGTNPLTGGQYNFNQLMNSGVNTEYTAKKAAVGVVYGSGGSNQNKLLEAGLEGFVTNQYSNMGGIKLGSGWNSKIKQSISVNLFSFHSQLANADKNPFNMQASNISSPDRQDAVITYQSAFTVAPGHALSVDLSQSFGSYKNRITEAGGTDRKDVLGGAFSGAGIDNYAVGLDYEGTVANTEVQAYLKKAGAGYNNPGNAFVRKGESRAGMSFNRKWFGQRLTVKYKNDLRVQYFDPAKNYAYHTWGNQLQFTWRFNRNNRWGLSFRDNKYAFENKAISLRSAGYTWNMQSDGSYLVKVNKTRISNTVLISRQHLEMPVVSGNVYQSHTWLINHTSSMVLKNNLLSATVTVNQSDNKDYLFNTSFINTECAYSYPLFNGIRGGTGTGYYINTGWNRQIGLRQQMGGQLANRLLFDVELSCKKAVKVIREQLADQFFMSAAVRYQF